MKEFTIKDYLKKKRENNKSEAYVLSSKCYVVFDLVTVNERFDEIAVLGYFSTEEKALNCLKYEVDCAKENGNDFEWLNEYTLRLTGFHDPDMVITVFIETGAIE